MHSLATLTASAAQSKLGRLIDEMAYSQKPIRIVGKHSNAVLIPESNWRAIQETIYLLSIPKMRQSIRKGLATPAAKCAKEPGW
ncbi:MAG: type II toxin-antitoxin system Phd/YefM family antitoxin [Nitrospira sp.]|nr:type II toxin-antitoxin system Phd/YefM family antitoxin [Nitrospira sp.]